MEHFIASLPSTVNPLYIEFLFNEKCNDKESRLAFERLLKEEDVTSILPIISELIQRFNESEVESSPRQLRAIQLCLDRCPSPDVRPSLLRCVLRHLLTMHQRCISRNIDLVSHLKQSNNHLWLITCFRLVNNLILLTSPDDKLAVSYLIHQVISIYLSYPFVGREIHLISSLCFVNFCGERIVDSGIVELGDFRNFLYQFFKPSVILDLPLVHICCIRGCISSFSPSVMKKVLFPLMQKCIEYGQVQQDSGVRTQSFEAICSWLGFIKSHELFDSLNPEIVELLLNHLCKFFADSYDSIRRKVMECFIALSKCVFEMESKNPELEAFFLDWLLSSGRLSSSKILHAVLSSILEIVGTESVMRCSPSFLSDLIECIKTPRNFPKAAALFEAFIRTWLSECSNISKFVNISWFDALVQSIISDSSALRNAVIELVFPLLMQKSPTHLGMVLQAVQDSEKFTSVLLSLIRIARDLGAIDGYHVSIDGMGYGLSSEEFKECLIHQDPDLRYEALSLLCDSKKRNSCILQGADLELLLFFLEFNSASMNPERRQLFESLFGKFLERLSHAIHIRIRDIGKCMSKYNRFLQSNDSLFWSEKDILNLKESISLLQTLLLFLHNLVALVKDWIYEGAPFHRFSIGMVVIRCLFRHLDPSAEIGRIETAELLSSDYFKEHLASLKPFSLASDSVYQILLLLLESTFDDIREESVMLLSKLPKVEGCPVFSLDQICERYFNSPVECKAKIGSMHVVHLYLVNHSRGKASALEFWDKLLLEYESRAMEAKRDIVCASKSYPVQGFICSISATLKYIPEGFFTKDEWRSIVERVIKINSLMYDVVMGILCQTTPEGYSPFSLAELDQSVSSRVVVDATFGDDEDEDYSSASQLLMGYCWRSAFEISNLFMVILKKGLLNEDEAVVLECCEKMKCIMLSIRHCGAFATIAPLFRELCILLSSSHIPAFSFLTNSWLRDILSVVSSRNSISVTRRSAGLPFSIVSLVCSDVGQGKGYLKEVMNSLLPLSERPLCDSDVLLANCDVPQIHAMNVLKALTAEASLRGPIVAYLSRLYILALKGFSSKNWGIRNCSMMLFGALVNRTTQDTSQSAVSFFQRYPDLYDFVLIKLMECSQSPFNWLDHAALYPILLLLSKFTPSFDEESNRRLLDPLVEIIDTFFVVSPVFRIRSMACRSLVTLMTLDECQLVSMVEKYLDRLNDAVISRNMNQLHGLLFALYLVSEACVNVALCDRFKSILCLPKRIEILRSLIEKRFCIPPICQSYAAKLLNACEDKLLLQVYQDIWSNGPKEGLPFSMTEGVRLLFTKDRLPSALAEEFVSNLKSRGHSSYEVLDSCLEVLCSMSCSNSTSNTNSFYESLLPNLLQIIEERESIFYNGFLQNSTRILIVKFLALNLTLGQRVQLNVIRDRLLAGLESPMMIEQSLLLFSVCQQGEDLAVLFKLFDLYSYEDQHDFVRYAVAKSLVRLLASESLRERSADLYRLLIRLLTDDDERIRVLISNQFINPFFISGSRKVEPSYALYLVFEELRKEPSSVSGSILSSIQNDACPKAADDDSLIIFKKERRNIYVEDRLLLKYAQGILKTEE